MEGENKVVIVVCHHRLYKLFVIHATKNKACVCRVKMLKILAAVIPLWTACH